MMYGSDLERFGQFLTAFFGVIIAALALMALVALVEYILHGIALSRMAQNAGMPSPFLAWIPVANAYLLGMLCERAMYRRTGRAWKFSVILPVIKALALLGGGVFPVFSLLAGSRFHGRDGFFSASPAGWLFELAGTVAFAIALYNLYWDYAQGREVLFTVLSVIFGMGQAIILFILRDRIPLSAQGGGWQQPCPGGYPQGPYPGGPYGPPYQNGPYAPPPYQGAGYPQSPQYPQYPQDPQSPAGPEANSQDPKGPEDRQ